MMTMYDPFQDIAPFYDRIMSHVTYDRWFTVASTLAVLAPKGFVHLDAACGTGTMVKRFRRAGWNSVGVDLSFAMVRAGTKGNGPWPAAAADLRALPLRGGIDYATCLFDSINFLLTNEDLDRSFREMHAALTPQGLYYFDIVTERMVTQHFDGQEWTENNGGFMTTWGSRYSPKTGIAETTVRVNSGAAGTVLERIFALDEVEQAMRNAGFVPLGAFDAHDWRSPGRKTTRIDIVAAKAPPRAFIKRFDTVCADLRRRLV